jgi:putative sugar O-methyltransferase
MNSISDTERYKKACINAVENEDGFQNFKNDPAYNDILEHVTPGQGTLYLNYIIANSPDLIERIDNFKDNDIYGGGMRHEYPGIGIISPSTLRYVKVLSDLIKIFGDLEGKKIVEIGAGYGGQCLIINKIFKIKEYSIIDLDEASTLSNKYLQKNDVNPRIIKIKDVPSIDEDFDIVISNYAYSELTKELQDLYYDKIIKRSKNGYITYNFISGIFNIDSYNKKEMFEKFTEKNINILEELPNTFEDNMIVYFKN